MRPRARCRHRAWEELLRRAARSERCALVSILRSSGIDAVITLRAAEKFLAAASVVSEAQPVFARRHADLACEQFAKRGNVFVAALLDDAVQRQCRSLQQLPSAGDALRLQVTQWRHAQARLELARQRALADGERAADAGDGEPLA